MRRTLGSGVLTAYRAGGRLWAKLFSLAVAGALDSFGAQSVIQPPLRIAGERRIAVGSNVFIGRGSWLQALGPGAAVAIEIGNGTRIVGRCTISAVRSVRLGEQVLVAGGVYIADHSHAFAERSAPVLDQGITGIGRVDIGDGAWLGQNVVVCPGVSIGRGAVIAANSVVKDDVPSFSVAAGAPARIVREFGPIGTSA